MASQKNDRHRVAVFQPCFPHYRRRLFVKMCGGAIDDPKYSVFFGRNTRQSAMKLLAQDEAAETPRLRERLRPITTLHFDSICQWQVGAITIALGSEFDTLMFEGNAKVLSTWLATVLARLRGKRVLFWTHGFLRDERGLKGWIRKRFYKLANALIHYGLRSREISIRKGFDPKRQYVCLNSLDHEKQVEIRRTMSRLDKQAIKSTLFPSPKHPLLLWVGRLEPRKRLDLLLYATRILQQRSVRANVLVVGDGPARADLANLVRELGMANHVRFYGACHDEASLGLLISSADVCVGPGEIGLSCIHAMTYGTPVITHGDFDRQMPEAEAVVPGRTGDFFRYGDAEDLADVVSKWLRRRGSREETRRACYAVVDDYYNPEHQTSVFNAAVCGIPAEKSLPTTDAKHWEDETPSVAEAA